MSKWKIITELALYLVCLVFIVLFCFLIIKLSFAGASGIRNWWHNETTTSPEEQAEIDKANAEWAKDPRNPKFVGQKCIDAGGIPNYSAWDGDVKECKGVGNNKNVNIEVNQ